MNPDDGQFEHAPRLQAALTALIKHLCAEGKGDPRRWRSDEIGLAKLVADMPDAQLVEMRNIGPCALADLRAWHRALGIGLPPSEQEQRIRAAIEYLTAHGYRVTGPVEPAS